MTGWLPGDLVAENTTNAYADGGRCPLCPQAILRGQRVAQLAADGQWAHTGCLDKAAPGEAAR